MRLNFVLTLALCMNGGWAAGQPARPSPSAAAFTDGDVTIKPPYANAPELTVKEGVPRGTIHELTMKSEDSRIYAGIARNQPGVVPYQRPVGVYVPAQYKPGSPAPFIVVQDGASPKYRATLPPILDNLIHEKRVPVLIAVMVHHGGGDGAGSERGLEYDTVSEKYTTFIESEVLPRIQKDYNITLTNDPEGRATMGGSSGAACAFTMAWFHPELYRKVLSYSGTFVNQENPRNPEISRGAWEYHATLIPNSARKPIRVWMHVGEHDNGSTRDEASLHNWVMANQRMAAALKAKGYHYRFVFAEGSGHTDQAVINQTLPEALVYVWQDYPIR
jgi:enterochelin esterase family protein